MVKYKDIGKTLVAFMKSELERVDKQLNKPIFKKGGFKKMKKEGKENNGVRVFEAIREMMNLPTSMSQKKNKFKILIIAEKHTIGISLFKLLDNGEVKLLKSSGVFTVKSVSKNIKGILKSIKKECRADAKEQRKLLKEQKKEEKRKRREEKKAKKVKKTKKQKRK